MDIKESHDSGVTTLAPKGEIDLHASPKLREALHEQVEKKAPVLLTDFSGVGYIDSSGLATLVEYVRDAKSFDGKFALYALQPKVKMVFELVRLNELFTITDTRDEALAALA
jgi:anti-sigma B factor antagonist